ncbi:MAG: Sua5/YciO/YrdC/YwlC family protein [Gammaproteobacteria bacterium]|jgi:tRNA threonylcarbamoyl adenosine modification protein (Sua5/YciO/YrdC/YwlC family)|nr:Sua5/YciO/YrdC/YwlC family protein [Gammaproteobacteria bacterium]
MTQRLHIHPTHPQERLVAQTVEVLKQSGGVIAYPTDSGYALGCSLGDKEALERIKKLRDLDKHHNFTLVCQNLSELGMYARVNNTVFRILKAHTPGPYTFILEATNEVPRRLQHPKKKTVGVRVPDNAIALAILSALGEPLMSVTLLFPGKNTMLADPDEIYECLKGKVDVMVDGGACGIEPTTVIDLATGMAEVVRVGKGPVF